MPTTTENLDGRGLRSGVEVGDEQNSIRAVLTFNRHNFFVLVSHDFHARLVETPKCP